MRHVGQVLFPQERLIPPALSLPRKIRCAVAAGILDKCHSFFYFPFLLIGDILHFLLLLRLLILALQLQSVNSSAEKWKRYNRQTMCQPQSAAIQTVLLTFFTNEGGGTFTNRSLKQGFSSFGKCSAQGDSSHLLAFLKQKVVPAPFEAHACEEWTFKKWDIPKSGCSWQ